RYQRQADIEPANLGAIFLGSHIQRRRRDYLNARLREIAESSVPEELARARLHAGEIAIRADGIKSLGGRLAAWVCFQRWTGNHGLRHPATPDLGAIAAPQAV